MEATKHSQPADSQPDKIDVLVEGKSGEEGASMLEYALLAALIAVVCILAITFLGRQACVSFSRVGSSMSVANG